MEKIGIMGGSFNPIHLGHLILAENARYSCQLNRIIFIPTGEHPFKNGSNRPSASDRLEMVKMAIQDNPFFELSDIEIKREGMCYTLDTVRELESIFPKAAFYLITGADIIFELDRWYEKEKLFKKLHFLTAHRPGYDHSELDKHIDRLKKEFGLKIKKITVPEIDISSSAIREKLLCDEPVKYMIPENVENYIFENSLYRLECDEYDRNAD